MPHFLTFIRIDWHHDRASAPLQQIVQRAHAEVSGSSHWTEDTLRTWMGELAAAHRDLVADVLYEGVGGDYSLWRAERGRVADVALEERVAEGARRAGELPYDQVASVTVTGDLAAIRALAAAEDEEGDDDDGDDGDDAGELELPLRYRSEAGLRALIDRVAAVLEDGTEEAFVAEAGDARYVVDLAPRAGRVRRLAFAGAGAAVAERLRRGEFVVPPAPPPVGRDPSAKYEVPLLWPEALLEELQAAATRTDRSLSSIVQLAWKTGAAAIASSGAEAIAPTRSAGRPRKQTIYMPGAMVDQLESEAARLDMSQSRLVHHAFALARSTIAALPDA